MRSKTINQNQILESEESRKEQEEAEAGKIDMVIPLSESSERDKQILDLKNDSSTDSLSVSRIEDSKDVSKSDLF